MSTPSKSDREIFLGALEKIDPREREAFLLQVCGGDTGLKRRIEDLLNVHDEPDSLLDQERIIPHLGIDTLFVPPVAEGPGTVIGPYKLLERLGEGGMGTVYVAEQKEPVRRKVALKVIKPGMDTREVIARFEAERQALAMMNHPNIAKVLDAGATAAGRPYFVMELVKGTPITDFCDQQKLATRQRLQLFIILCQAVQHAHQKGLIHRDLKPSNLLVEMHDVTPFPKVIDFGVAKAIGESLTEKTLHTGYSQMVGTPLYMSPEQAGQSSIDVDTRSDVYSLGVLLYEILTGQTPFESETLCTAGFDEMRRMIREVDPPRPSARVSTLLAKALSTVSDRRQIEPRKLSRQLKGELDWIVMKSLEKDRNRRYATANDFAGDVQRYLNDEPVLACPPSAMYRLRKLVRRNKGLVLAASLLVLALVGGIIGTTRGMIRATVAEADAVNEAKQKETALAATRKSVREANDQLFLALLNQARAHRFSRQMGQRMDSLDALAKAAAIRPDERLRDEAIAALALPDVRRGPSLDAPPAGTTGIAFDGTYQSYAQLNDRGRISIRNIRDNEEIQCIETKSTSRPSFLWLSPNGQFLAVLNEQNAVQLWRVADGKSQLDEELRPCSSVAFSPDSRTLVVGRDDWILCIDLASGQETNRWRMPAEPSALAFHPDNRRLAVGFANNNVTSVYDSHHGSHVADLPVGSIDNQVIAWHPDGARLAVAGSDPRIQIWDVATQCKLATLVGHVEQVTVLSFHPDGGLLASASWEGVLRLWDPCTGRQLMRLPVAAVPQFSSTGQWLGCLWQAGQPAQLLEVTPSREYRTIVSSQGAGQGHYHDGDISPDGRLLAMGMGDTGDRLWDLSTGREVAVLPFGSTCVLFHPDGRELLAVGAAGLNRRSIQHSNDTANEVRIGPPIEISLPFVPVRASRSLDGRTLAIVSETAGAGLLMDLTTQSGQGLRFAHPGVSFVALSQDSQWVATSGWHSDRVRLWNAKTGDMVNEWVLGMMTVVFFTPDSRSLIISRGDGFTFWDVETLQPIRRLDRDVGHQPGYVAFSADGGLMALEMAPSVIHLKEVTTGRTVAKLEDPHGDQAWWMGFTPDGTQLVVAARYAKAIHLWDLRAIRQRLKAMKLDWDWPEFPAAAAARQAAGQVKMKNRLRVGEAVP